MSHISLRAATSVAEAAIASVGRPFEGLLAPFDFYEELVGWQRGLLQHVRQLVGEDALAAHLLAADIRGYPLDWPVQINDAPLVARREPDGALIRVFHSAASTSDCAALAEDAASAEQGLLILDILGVCADTVGAVPRVQVQRSADVAAAIGAELLWDVQLSRAETMLALPVVKEQYLAVLRDGFGVSASDLLVMSQRSRELRSRARARGS